VFHNMDKGIMSRHPCVSNTFIRICSTSIIIKLLKFILHNLIIYIICLLYPPFLSYLFILLFPHIFFVVFQIIMKSTVTFYLRLPKVLTKFLPEYIFNLEIQAFYKNSHYCKINTFIDPLRT